MHVISELEKGKSQKQIQTETGVYASTIRYWIKLYNNLGYNGFITKFESESKIMSNNKVNEKIKNENETLKKELKDMKKKLEQSEMENAVLKKLDSLVQERVKQQNKKK